MEIKHTFSFGKIAFTGKRKAYPTEISVRITGSYDRPVLSISAYVYNTKHTDCVLGGQCLDELKPYFTNDTKFQTLYQAWKQYHLNDMHAGTIEQEQALQYYKESQGLDRLAYSDACNYLKSINLFEVAMNNGTTYRYGSGWLYQPIPTYVIDELINMIREDN